MTAQQYDFGMIGLGTMGRNLVYNMCDQGFSVAGYDTDPAKVAALDDEADGKNVLGIPALKDFIAALKSPKTIMLLVPAGPIVDAVVKELKPFLADNDLVMDCGNSHFTDTDWRIKELAEAHIHFMGVGISGGESGARHGPSIMPGGSPEAYARIAPMLEAVSAKVDGKPCVALLGAGSAGHYVKMVHNGIEYALMQVLAEAYHILKQCFEMSNDDLHTVFEGWNKGRLKSYLTEITADIFKQQDDLTGNRLIEMIQDASKQNGTGKWTSQSAMDLFVPLSAIDTAVTARDISTMKAEREAAQKKLGWHSAKLLTNKDEVLLWLEDAVYFSTIIAYAQGFALLQQVSKAYRYELKLAEIARIWSGGCIIRSAFLSSILTAYKAAPDLQNLLLNDELSLLLETCQDGMRLILKAGVDAGVPMPVMMASLAYFDSYRSGWLPANLIQAQRDYFGAHTYERVDRAGIFHTQWNHLNSDGSNN